MSEFKRYGDDYIQESTGEVFSKNELVNLLKDALSGEVEIINKYNGNGYTRTEEQIRYVERKIERELSKSEKMRMRGEVKYNPNARFVRMFTQEIYSPHKERILTDAEIGILARLSNYMQTARCILVKENNKTFIGKKDLFELFNLSEKSCYKFYNKLIAEKILIEVEPKKKYALNPYIFFNGNTIKKETLNNFKDYQVRSKRVAKDDNGILKDVRF